MAYSSDFLHGPKFIGGGGGVSRWQLISTDAIGTLQGVGYVSDGQARGIKTGDIVYLFAVGAFPFGSGNNVTDDPLMAVARLQSDGQVHLQVSSIL